MFVRTNFWPYSIVHVNRSLLYKALHEQLQAILFILYLFGNRILTIESYSVLFCKGEKKNNFMIFSCHFPLT